MDQPWFAVQRRAALGLRSVAMDKRGQDRSSEAGWRRRGARESATGGGGTGEGEGELQRGLPGVSVNQRQPS